MRMHHWQRGFCSVLALAPSALLPIEVGAQDTGTAESSTSQPVLEQIVVIAQKRSENLQDVPVSMTAITGELLEKLKLDDASQIAQYVPNLTVQTPYGQVQPLFSLRGVSLIDYSQHQESPIAMYVDEGYKGIGMFRAQQLYDVERIEVLRGPQGTLFGRNTTGGSVNIYTVQPKLEGTEGYVTAGYGNYNMRELGAALEVTPSEGVFGIRAAFDGRKSDGFLRALQPGVEDFANDNGHAFRISAALHPTSDLRFNLTYSRSDSDTRPAGYPAGSIGPDGIGYAGLFNDGQDFHETNAGDQGFLDVENESVLLRAEWDLGREITLTAISTYNRGNVSGYSDDDDTPLDITADGIVARAKAWSQEIRLASRNAGPFTWLVGGAASKDDIEAGTNYEYFGAFSEDVEGTPSCLIDLATGCIYTNQFDLDRRSLSAFAHLTYAFANGFELQGGLRYTNDRTDVKDYRSFLGYFDPATGNPVLGAESMISASPFDFTDENVSGKIALRYVLTPEASVYASYSRGYRSGSINGYAYFDPVELTPVKPELVDAFEIGVKSELLDRRLRLNGALFHYKYQDQQFQDVTPQGFERLVNAPRSRIWGAELEANAALTSDLSISAALGYANGKFQELTLGETVLDSNRLPSSPRWTFNGAFDWTIMPYSAASLDLHLDARYTGLQYFDAFNAPGVAQRGYWLVNGRVSKPIGATGMELSLWVKNLLDRNYYAYILDVQSNQNSNNTVPGAPRTFGGDITFRF